jgi:MFS family permease
MQASARTIAFLNLGHALDHLFMLIFPTAVLAMGPEFGRPYSELLPLSLGGFIAFGAFSLPAGWLGDHWDRRSMIVVFFIGIGASSILTGLARTETQIAICLTLIGAFAAIYHPVGIAMLVRNHPRLGKALGVNGFFGNLGVALAAVVTGALAEFAGWRAAFIVPGVLSIAAGIGFWLTARSQEKASTTQAKKTVVFPRAILVRVFVAMIVATVCGGIIFNATTVAMPKIFDERLNALTNTTAGIGFLVAIVYLIAAFSQLVVGSLIDRFSLRTVFLGVAVLQPPLLFLAASAENLVMLTLALLMMLVVFGQLPVNDAMVARYTDDTWRARVYAVRYVVSFGASATAVPMIAYLHGSGGGFGAVFMILAALGAIILAAALYFPRSEAQRAPAPA